MSTPNPMWSDLCGGPQAVADVSVSVEEALASGHPGVIAVAAGAAASKAESALVTCALHLADHGPLNGSICAVAASLRALADHEGVRKALPLARAFDVVAAHLRSPSASPSAASAPAESLAEAIGAGDVGAAVAWATDRGASVGRQEFENELIDALYQTAERTAHLAPVVVAAVEVARVAESEQATRVLSAAAVTLVSSSVTASTELVAAAEPMVEHVDDVWAREDEAKAAAFQEARFRPHLLGARPAVQTKALTRALAFGVPRALVAGSVCLAAADRLLRFDPSLARSERTPEGWLDLGWLLQVAVATRKLLILRDCPQWLQLLVHVTMMIGGASSLDGADATTLPEPQAAERNWDHGPQIAQVSGAMLAGQAERAMAALRGYLLMVLPEQPLCAGLVSAALEDRAATAAQQGQLLASLSAALEAFSAATSLAHRELLPCAAIHLFVELPNERPVHKLAHRVVDAAEGGRSVAGQASLPWLNR